MIYFLQSVDGGPVKIGTTENFPARLAQLQMHYGKSLALLAELPGGRVEEREIHGLFSHLRLGRTEQFRPDPELMAFIGRPVLACANPEAVEAMPVAAVTTIYSLKGTTEWRDWLQRGAKHCRTDAAKLIDAAVLEYLAKRGFTEKPPER